MMMHVVYSALSVAVVGVAQRRLRQPLEIMQHLQADPASACSSEDGVWRDAGTFRWASARFAASRAEHIKGFAVRQ